MCYFRKPSMPAPKSEKSNRTGSLASNSRSDSVNEFAHLFDIARETLPLIRGENIGEMLLFKHFSPDWKNYQKHFKIIERDYFEIGIRAVEQLKKELEKIQKYLEK